MVGVIMRNISRVTLIGFCILLPALLGACSHHGTYTQTFVIEKDSTRSLSLTSNAGVIRPAAQFPANVLFKVFGTDQLEGTYVLVNGDQKTKGKFIAGKDGETRWIKFTSEDKPEWRVKVIAGALVEPDSTTWTFEGATATATASAKLGVKFGE